MAEFDKTNSGVMFVNDHKQPGDSKPDRSGSLNVGGVEYFLDGWIKKSSAGATFMSISVKRKDKQPEQEQRPARQTAPAGGGFDDMDSMDVPF